MSIEKSDAYLIHALHCFHDSQSEEISHQNRVLLADIACELILKALYYKHFPGGHIRGHLCNELLDDICCQLNIRPPQNVVEATRRVEEHYEASRYPEETMIYFHCLEMRPGCQLYPDALPSIRVDMDTIYAWADAQLK